MGQSGSFPEIIINDLSNEHKSYYDTVYPAVKDQNMSAFYREQLSDLQDNHHTVSYTEGDIIQNADKLPFLVDRKFEGKSMDLKTRCDLLLSFNKMAGVELFNEFGKNAFANYESITYTRYFDPNTKVCQISRTAQKKV